MKEQTLVHKPLPQNPDIWVSVPNYKEPILPVAGGFGWYGLQAYDWDGDKLMCHICGKFQNSIGKHSLQSHKLNPIDYRHKFGLLPRTSLSSKTSSAKRSEMTKAMFNNPDRKRVLISNLKHGGATPKLVTRGIAELVNRHDT